VTEEMKRQPFAGDCLKIAEQTIVESDLLDPNTLAQWRKDAVAQVDEAVATAQKEAVPEADKEDWCALSVRDLVDQAGEDE
jgi:TPP-dependent pyruvate/acetoin dehydrogenase alpha subunit